jgi:hypothetical protein
MKRLAVVLVMTLIVACGSLPKRKEISADYPSVLEVLHAPEGAQVWADGNLLGVTEKKKVRFSVASGIHKVRIISGSATLYDRDVVVEKGTVRQVNLEAP